MCLYHIKQKRIKKNKNKNGKVWKDVADERVRERENEIEREI